MGAAAVERVVAEPRDTTRRLLVRPLVGFAQDGSRRSIDVLPSPTVTVMFQLGRPFDGTPMAFVAGPRSSSLSVTCQGRVACIDLKMSPLGAAALFGPVVDELVDRTVDLLDVLPGRASESVVEQLPSVCDWPGRISCVQRFLQEALRKTHPVDDRVVRAWTDLCTLGGTARIVEVASRSGWSHRHFIEQFRRSTGLTPKSAARLIRVHHAMEALRGRASLSLVQVAMQCGYADQAHMSRELLQFTGFSPDRFRRSPHLVPAGTVPNAVEPPPPRPPR